MLYFYEVTEPVICSHFSIYRCLHRKHVMTLLKPLKRRLSYWLIGLALLLLLSGCNWSSTFSNPGTHPTSTSSAHSTNQPSSSRSANKPEIRHFADTWNNIHSFLSF